MVPFFKVSVRKDIKGSTDRDISHLISRFSYEDAIDVDNMLTLEIKQDAIKLLEDTDMQQGAIVTFYWGYLGGSQSQKYLARLANRQTTYEDIVTSVYQCTDLGLLLKKNTSKKDWKGKTSTQIVQAIADYYGLNAYVDQTTKVWDFNPQGGRTDYAFLKYLASIEKNGSMRFFIRGDGLYFTRLKLEEESKRTFTYKDGNGILLSFRPFSRETAKSNAARDTVITSIDPFTNQVVQKKVNDSTAKDDKKLGEYASHIYNADGAQVGTKEGKRPSQVQAAQKDTNRAGKHLITPDSEQIEDIGNNVKKNAALDEIYADIKTQGDPLILSDQVITLDGVPTIDRGNWHLTRAKHVIDSGGGYILNMTGKKNAVAKPNSDIQDDVNKSAGPREANVKKKVGVYTYDGDAVEISSPKTNGQ